MRSRHEQELVALRSMQEAPDDAATKSLSAANTSLQDALSKANEKEQVATTEVHTLQAKLASMDADKHRIEDLEAEVLRTRRELNNEREDGAKRVEAAENAAILLHRQSPTVAERLLTAPGLRRPCCLESAAGLSPNAVGCPHLGRLQVAADNPAMLL